MKPVDQLQTMALTYQEICQGEEPWLLHQTPGPFVKRNIYCGDRVFANKWEVVEQYHSLHIPA